MPPGTRLLAGAACAALVLSGGGCQTSYQEQMDDFFDDKDLVAGYHTLLGRPCVGEPLKRVAHAGQSLTAALRACEEQGSECAGMQIEELHADANRRGFVLLSEYHANMTPLSAVRWFRSNASRPAHVRRVTCFVRAAASEGQPALPGAEAAPVVAVEGGDEAPRTPAAGAVDGEPRTTA